ncbi:hypothetical protein AMTRI_Chr09g17780 [Amborella trichopoda]
MKWTIALWTSYLNKCIWGVELKMVSSVRLNVMMSKSDFGWDDKLHKATALEELWSEYLKDYPRAKMYRTKMISFFSSLPIVLGDDKADGRYGVVGTDLEGNRPPIDDIGCDSEGENNQSVDEAIDASITKIVVAFLNAMEHMTKKRQRLVNNQELMTELKTIERLTSHDYFKATKYLVEHLDIIVMFIDMELQLRKNWVAISI